MKKLLAALLAALMLAGCLAACGETPATSEETTAAAAVTESVSDTEAAETEYAILNVSDDVKFNGTTLKVLYWSDVERPEFFVETQTGEKVNDAILAKNERTEGQLGVTFDWVGTPGNYGNQAAFVSAAENASTAGDAYDMHCGYSLTASTLTVKGLTQNLSDNSYLDFSKPWWPKTLVEAASIHDKLYFCSGDISSNLLYMMYGCFFNKDLYEDLHKGEASVYSFAKEGTWTLDKMFELSTGAYQDTNADNSVSYGDTFGFETLDIHFDAFYTGCGMVNLVKDAEGNLQVSDDLSGEKAYQCLDKITSFLGKSQDAYAKGTNSTNRSDPEFAGGRVLFTFDRVYMTTFACMKEASISYGIVPIPKLDENQENYVTCMAFPYTMYSVSSFSKNKDAAYAAMQVMAYYSYLNVTPALFEETMKLRYSEEADDSLMYDLIRETVYIDLGRIFSTELNNITYSLWRDSMKSLTANGWASMSKVQVKRLNSLLDKINTTLASLE